MHPERQGFEIHTLPFPAGQAPIPRGHPIISPARPARPRVTRVTLRDPCLFERAAARRAPNLASALPPLPFREGDATLGGASRCQTRRAAKKCFLVDRQPSTMTTAHIVALSPSNDLTALVAGPPSPFLPLSSPSRSISPVPTYVKSLDLRHIPSRCGSDARLELPRMQWRPQGN